LKKERDYVNMNEKTMMNDVTSAYVAEVDVEWA